MITISEFTQFGEWLMDSAMWYEIRVNRRMTVYPQEYNKDSITFVVLTLDSNEKNVVDVPREFIKYIDVAPTSVHLHLNHDPVTEMEVDTEWSIMILDVIPVDSTKVFPNGR